MASPSAARNKYYTYSSLFSSSPSALTALTALSVDLWTSERSSLVATLSMALGQYHKIIITGYWFFFVLVSKMYSRGIIIIIRKKFDLFIWQIVRNEHQFMIFYCCKFCLDISEALGDFFESHVFITMRILIIMRANCLWGTYYYYLFTAIGFAPGGSSPTLVQTKTIKQHYTVVQHNTMKLKHKVIRW
jgi:hypothetical protein